MLASIDSLCLASRITVFPMFRVWCPSPRRLPITSNVGDTVDPRQKDQTHTALRGLNADWTLHDRQHLEFAGFFRTYNLSLYSDFVRGGLIQQSEFRLLRRQRKLRQRVYEEPSFAGRTLDLEREAPRRDDLDHFNFYTPGDMNYGSFTKVDGSDITITPIAPYAALKGEFGSHLRFYLGWRRDQIAIDNQDLVLPQNSFDQWVGVNSPKATVSVISAR